MASTKSPVSYASESHQDICAELEDRTIKNSRYVAIEKSRQQDRKDLGNLLVQQRQAKKEKTGEETERNQTTLPDQGSHATTEETPWLTQRSRTRAQKHMDNREQKIAVSEAQIESHDRELANTLKEVSRLDWKH